MFFGLVAALSWGSGDFLVRFATLRTGFLRTLFYLQIVSGVVVAGLLLFQRADHALATASWQAWLWAVVAALLNVISSLALYRAIEIGPLSIVAPITATYAAVTVALSLLTGEHIAPLRGVGLGLAVVGVGLASWSPTPSDGSATTRPRTVRGVALLAGLASIGYGTRFWLLGRAVTPSLGQLAPTLVLRIVSLAVIILVAVAARQPLRLAAAARPWATLALVAVIALLDTAAYTANFLGYQSDAVAIVSVMASLYGMVTVALAAIFLRERLAHIQWGGIALIFLGVLLVSLRLAS